MSATVVTSPQAPRPDPGSGPPPRRPGRARATGRRRVLAVLAVGLLVALAWRLWPGEPAPMAPYEDLTPDVRGTYRLDDGDTLTLWGSRSAPSVEVAGTVTHLVADGDDRYRTGDGGTLTITRDPADVVTGVELHRAGEPAASGDLDLLHTEVEVAFSSDHASLAGTLLLPTGSGPHPAVVMVHGAAPSRRDGTYLFASHLARRGVATLIYDKRGVGESTGHHASATFDQLTADALAGVSMLAAQPEVDPERIGVLGWSQGGWIAAQAAAASDDVAYVVANSPSGFSPADQQAWLHGSMLTARGFDRTAMRIADRVDRMAYSSLDLVDAGLMPAIPDVPGFWFHSLDPYLDTDALWEDVRQPVLAVWGEVDCQVPARDSARSLERALRRGGNRDVTLAVLPGADHSLTSTDACGHETGLAHGDGYEYPDGVFGLAAAWINGGHELAETTATTVDDLPSSHPVLGWHLDPPTAAPWYGTILVQVAVAVLLLGVFVVTGGSWAAGRVAELVRRRCDRRLAVHDLAGLTALVGFAAAVAGVVAIVEIAVLGGTHAALLVGGPTVAGSSPLLTGARVLVGLTLGLAALTGVSAVRSRAIGRLVRLVGAGVGLLALWAAYWQLLPLP